MLSRYTHKAFILANEYTIIPKEVKIMRRSARFAKGDKKAFKKWFDGLSKEDQQKWLDSQEQYSISPGSNKPMSKAASAERVAFRHLLKTASDQKKK